MGCFGQSENAWAKAVLMRLAWKVCLLLHIFQFAIRTRHGAGDYVDAHKGLQKEQVSTAKRQRFQGATLTSPQIEELKERAAWQPWPQHSFPVWGILLSVNRFLLLKIDWRHLP